MSSVLFIWVFTMDTHIFGTQPVCCPAFCGHASMLRPVAVSPCATKKPVQSTSDWACTLTAEPDPPFDFSNNRWKHRFAKQLQVLSVSDKSFSTFPLTHPHHHHSLLARTFRFPLFHFESDTLTSWMRSGSNSTGNIISSNNNSSNSSQQHNRAKPLTNTLPQAPTDL